MFLIFTEKEKGNAKLHYPIDNPKQRVFALPAPFCFTKLKSIKKVKNYLMLFLLSTGMVVFNSCSKENAVTEEVINEQRDYEGLVSKELLLSDGGTVVKLTFWCESLNKINDYLNDHELLLSTDHQTFLSSETTAEVPENLDESTSFDLMIDHEVMQLAKNINSYTVSIITKESSKTNLKSDYTFTSPHKSANDWTGGRVTHKEKLYSNDYISIDWDWLNCSLCFWHDAGNDVVLDNGATDEYIGPTSYKIRATIKHNYYDNYDITFFQPQ